MTAKPPQPTTTYARLARTSLPWACHTTVQPWEDCSNLDDTAAKQAAPKKQHKPLVLQNSLQEWMILNCISDAQERLIPLEFCHTKFQQILPHSRKTAQPPFDFKQAYSTLQEQLDTERC